MCFYGFCAKTSSKTEYILFAPSLTDKGSRAFSISESFVSLFISFSNIL